MSLFKSWFGGGKEAKVEKYAPPTLPNTSTPAAKLMGSGSVDHSTPPSPSPPPTSTSSREDPLFDGMVVKVVPPITMTGTGGVESTTDESNLFEGLEKKTDADSTNSGGFSFMKETQQDTNNTPPVSPNDDTDGISNKNTTTTTTKKKVIKRRGKAAATQTASPPTDKLATKPDDDHAHIVVAPTNTSTSSSSHDHHISLGEKEKSISTESSPKELHTKAATHGVMVQEERKEEIKPPSKEVQTKIVTKLNAESTVKTAKVAVEKKEEESEEIKHKLRSLEDDLSKALSLCRQKTDEMNSSLIKILDQKTDLMQKTIDLRVKLKTLEAEQSTLIAHLHDQQDDFEKAERLSEEIDNLNRRIVEIQHQDEELTVGYLSQKEKILHTRNMELQFHQEFIEQVQRLQAQQEAYIAKQKNEGKIKIAAEQERINIEEDKLNRAHSRFDFELKQLEQEEKEATLAIATKTQPFEMEKEMWLAKKQSVRKEIEAILVQLRAKEAEEAQYTSKIATLQEDIDRITSKYRKSLAKVAQQRGAVAQEKSKSDQDRKQLEEAKKAVTLQEKACMSAVAAAQLQLANITKMISHSRDQLTIINEKKSLVTKEDVIELLEDEEADMKELKSMLERRKEIVKQRSANLLALQEELSSIKEQIQTAQRNIPQLEANKKLAVTARNFKDAAKITNDIKQQTTLISEFESKIGVLNSNIENAKALVVDADQEVTAMESKVSLRQKSSDERKFKAIKKRLARLPDSSPEKPLLRTTAHLIALMNDWPLPDDSTMAAESTLEMATNTKGAAFEQPAPATEVKDFPPVAPTIQENHSAEPEATQASSLEMAAESSSMSAANDDREQLLRELEESESRINALIESESFEEAETLQKRIDQLKVLLSMNS